MGGDTQIGTSMPVLKSLLWTMQQMYVRDQRKRTHVKRSTQTRESPGWEAKAPLFYSPHGTQRTGLSVPVHHPRKGIVLLNIYRTQISKEVQTQQSEPGHSSEHTLNPDCSALPILRYTYPKCFSNDLVNHSKIRFQMALPNAGKSILICLNPPPSADPFSFQLKVSVAFLLWSHVSHILPCAVTVLKFKLLYLGLCCILS